MIDSVERLPYSRALQASDAEVIRHLEQEIIGGKHWYIALLEAIGQWSSSEEFRNGRVYHYLVDDEAFDWLLLAERLCEAVDNLVPGEEKEALLFHGRPPVDLTLERTRELIGGKKYTQYLNYFYGIVVEKTLILAVQEEVRKERLLLAYSGGHDEANEAYRRIYGTTKAVLLRRFRRENNYSQPRSITLAELKEFTYWLFKYRLRQCDKAKVASDTKKALEQLKRLWTGRDFLGVLATEQAVAESGL